MDPFSSRECMLAGGTLVIAAAVLGAHVAAQTAIPDFAPGGAGWTVGPAQADYIAVPGSPSPTTADPAHPHVPNIVIAQGKQPTFRVADLSNPNLKPWAKDLMKKDNDEVLKGKIAFTPRQSCLPAGVPGFILYGGGSVFFVQTPKKVTMIFDGDMQVRHVYMDVPHSANPKPSWYGESVGHYEGDTLVIDTIAQTKKTVVDAYRTPHTDKLHTIERWRMVEDGKTLEVVVTIDDPETYNQTWQGVRRYRRGQAQLGEQICAEGNFLLFDYGVPVDNTPDF